MQHLTHLFSSHDPFLVVLSVIIAIIASYTALDLAGRVAAARNRSRLAWLIGGAMAMGTGIWSMHFTAMLAFKPPVPVSYHLPTVAVSYLAAVFASALALWIVSRPTLKWYTLVTGGLVMGAAIVAMHYTGMAAMRLQARLSYDPGLFTLSVVIAIVASMAALWLAFHFRTVKTTKDVLGKAVSAVVMGFAISGMHYTGMAASIFVKDSSLAVNLAQSIDAAQLGVSAIVVGTMTVLGIALLASLLAQRAGRLTYTQKFAFISILFLIPLTAFYPLADEQRVEINNYGYKELYGAEYLRALQHVLQNVQWHQFLLDQYVDGAVTQDEVMALQAQVDKDFGNLQEVHDRDASELGLAANDLAKLRDRWQGLKEAAFRPDPETRDFQHGRMIESIRDLINQIGDESYLILDPDLDTYYMMDAILLKIPESQSLLSQIRLLSKTAIKRRKNGEAGLKERGQLTALVGLLRNNFTAMNKNIDTAFRNDASGEMRTTVVDSLASRSFTVNKFASLIEERVIAEQSAGLEVSELSQSATAALEANAKLYDQASVALAGGIQRRINTLTNRLIFGVVFALLTAAVAFTVGVFMMRSISRPLNELTAATRRLAEGELSARVGVSTMDEVGLAGAAFNQMAEQLQTSQQQLASRNRALAASADISRRLSTLLESKQIISTVTEQIKSAFNYYHVHVYLYDDKRENLVMAGGTGEAGKTMMARGHRILPGRGLVGRAAENNLPVLVPDTTQDPGWLPNPLLPNTKAEAAVPIAFGDEVVGVLDVQHNVRGELGPEDTSLLQAIANQIAIALRNARSLQQARQKAEQEATAHLIGQRIQTAGTVEEAMQIAVRELGRALKAQQTRVKLNTGQPKNGNGQAGNEIADNGHER